jgi:CheY-like chemotaxis protein
LRRLATGRFYGANGPRLRDEEPPLALIRGTLAVGDYSIVGACDAEESLEPVRGVHPDLIVRDLVMPARNAADVLADFRADLALAATPVLILTVRTQARDGTERLGGHPAAE